MYFVSDVGVCVSTLMMSKFYFTFNIGLLLSFYLPKKFDIAWIQGGITHQDFAGHKGTIRTGDVQVGSYQQH